MLGKFSEKAQKAMAISESIAFDLGHASVGSEHLLLALLKIKESKLRTLLEKDEINYENVREEIVSLFGNKEAQPFYMEYTIALKNILEKALLESKKINEDKVGLDTLIYALVDSEDNVAIEMLIKRNVNIARIKKELRKDFKKYSELDNIDDLVNINNFVTKEPTCVVGRDKEINLLCETLLRKQKANAIIIGEPGVGKTALVYHLAHLINQQKVSERLQNKVIYELDIASVVAGTKYRGEFEEKLKKIIKKVKDDKNAIIFIDEIHNIIGAGGAEGAIDASNILKPYLSRGDFQCIGATTYDEYVKIVEKERALERRYQIIKLDEPSLNETTNILTELAKTYETFYDLIIEEKTLSKLIQYCDVYISEKFFPDKAIDVMDCACVRSKSHGESSLSEDTIIEVIEDLYHVKVVKDKKVNELKKILSNRILGQEAAIEQIIKQVRCIEEGISEDNKPLSVMLFIGPTGVGKTEIAKILASTYFGNEKRLYKVDMSEYMESYSVSKLIGAAPGYIGHDNQTFLVDKIRKNPHCLVLLDEIEKAHKDVLNIFLNVFDEGYFIDANKRKIDFKNSIIVMTSNLGYSEDLFHKKSIGFNGISNFKTEIQSAIQQHFKPEFLNRIDEIIYFSPLDKTTCSFLSKRYLQEYENRIKVEFGYSDDFINSLTSDSDIIKYGARGIRRKIKDFVSEELDKKSKQEDLTKIK